MANVPLKTIKFPGLPDTYVVESGDPSLGITGATPGQIPVVKSVDENGNPTEWETTATPVTSVNGKTGAVELNASDVGAVSKDDITQRLGTAQTLTFQCETVPTAEITVYVTVQSVNYQGDAS